MTGLERGIIRDSAAAGERSRDRHGLTAIVVMALIGVGGQLYLRWATAGLTHESATTFAAVLPLIAGLAVPTAAMLIEGRRLDHAAPTWTAITIVIAAGLAMRLLWLGVPVPLEDDYNRYLLDGAMVARGFNPYLVAPLELLEPARVPPGYGAIAIAAQSVLGGINFPDLRTIYPSTAQAAFALAYLIAPFDADGLRIVFTAGELATAVLLMVLLRQLGQSPLWAALYWLNPAIAYLMVAICHVDALVPTFTIAALVAASSAWLVLACGLIGLAAGVKIWPLVLAPLLLWRLRREPLRLAAAGLVLGLALAFALGPVLLSSLQPGSGLAAYSAGWSNHNAIYAWIAHTVGIFVGDPMAQRILRSIIAAIVAVTALVLAVRTGPTAQDLLGSSLFLSAMIFYLSPAEFPWYAVWFLPLAAAARCWALLLASVVTASYYLFFPLWALSRYDLYFFWVGFIHALPVLGWLLVDRLRRHPTA